MLLVVTEKPSVARDLGRVLGATRKREGFLEGDDLRISWCFGHMCELVQPEVYAPAWKKWSFDTLPMVPERFRLQVREGAREHWKILAGLLASRENGEVVNACDAGREGELIFRYAWELAGGRGQVSRLWVASLTDSAIKAAWASRRPAAVYDPLADAARCRSEADWLVGLNATRAMTCLARSAGGEQLLSVGRVQTPTLAMIVGRDREIEGFVPEAYWRVEADLGSEPGGLRARWFRHDTQEAPARTPESEGEDEALPVERLADEALAARLVAAIRGRDAVIIESERRERRERPPLLYDLTALQRRANQRYGFPADKTLELAQGLYEAKLLTYPRTDARFITPDQVPELPAVLRALAELPPYRTVADNLLAAPIQPGRRVVNAAEVGDHHAILPTSSRADPARLGADQKRIYDLVARRLLAALSGDTVFDSTNLIAEVRDTSSPEPLPSPPRLRARGRVCRERGWQEIDPPKSSAERELPLLPVGASLVVRSAEAIAGSTRPPRRHTDASLLQQMETAGRKLEDEELARALRNAGLGTPATRAAILDTLLKRAFIERQGKELWATARGVALIEALPVLEFKSAELTGRWEARLSAIAEGKEKREPFMADVVARLREVVAELKVAPPPAAEHQAGEGPALGACPRCRAPVLARRNRYSCQANCGFVVWGTIAKREVSARMVRQLLKDGHTTSVKGWKSKAGKSFDAGLKLDAEFKVGFVFEGGERPRRAPPRPEGLPCPACKEGKVIAGKQAWGCSRWRESCVWKLGFVEDGLPVDPQEAARRVLGR